MIDSHPDHSPLPGLVVSAVQRVVEVVEQRQLARDTYCLRLHCPELARQIVPGQFFMVRAPDTTDPLLGRPFALYDIYEEHGEPAGVDFGYIVIGKLTSIMSRWKPGQPVELWGPLGNGFPPPPAGHLMMVAGGIGQTPFLAVAREALGLQDYGRAVSGATGGSSTRARVDSSTGGQAASGTPPSRLTMCYGVRSAEYLAGLDDFALPGLDVRISTDDGSRGHHGFVTDLLAESLQSDGPPDAVYCCGPEPMMEVVQQMCLQRNVPCWLSLESPMACGFGACFSCVKRVKLDDGSWDYRRTCVEGPVFEAEQLIL